MKKIYASLLVILCATAAHANAGLTCAGTYKLTSSSSKMDAEITETGEFHSIRSRVGGTLNSLGVLYFDRSVVEGPVTSFNKLNAIATRFNQPISIGSGEAHFLSCDIGDLYIQDNNDQALPTVHLKGSTYVNGTITFATGKGKVYKDEDVEIKGEVKGGKLIDLSKSD